MAASLLALVACVPDEPSTGGPGVRPPTVTMRDGVRVAPNHEDDAGVQRIWLYDLIKQRSP